MGVYIDMEMPKDGFITITVTSDGRVLGNSKKENGKFEYLGNEDIAKAVSVPEPYGRLIDAEQLKETLDYYIREAGWSDEINKALNWVKDEFIDSEKTIIPASEEGE